MMNVDNFASCHGVQKLLAVLDELETLKPKVRRQLDEPEKVKSATQQHEFNVPNQISYVSSLNNRTSLSYTNKQVLTMLLVLSSILLICNCRIILVKLSTMVIWIIWIWYSGNFFVKKLRKVRKRMIMNSRCKFIAVIYLRTWCSSALSKLST